MSEKEKTESGIAKQVRSDFQMLDEIVSLKHQIGGYKTANEKYKKQVAKLNDEILGLKEEIEKRKSNEHLLQENLNELRLANAELQATIRSNDTYTNELENTIEQLRKPWWKKIF